MKGWVVVKRIRMSNDPGRMQEAQRQLQREQMRQMRMQSEFVAPVLDTGWHPEFGPFIVTPYYPSTLARTLARRDFVPTLEYALRVVEQVMLGLIDCWHGGGVVHLDVKPANIALDPDGNVKLLDFGLAKILAGNLDQTSGAAAFTKWYAPREQILRKPKNWATSACDVRAVSATLYEILTGYPPFYREALEQNLLDPHTKAELPPTDKLWRLLLDGTPTTPVAMLPALPAAVSDLVMRGLDHDPQRRAPGRHPAEVVNALDDLRRIQRATRRHEGLAVGDSQVVNGPLAATPPDAGGGSDRMGRYRDRTRFGSSAPTAGDFKQDGGTSQ